MSYNTVAILSPQTLNSTFFWACSLIEARKFLCKPKSPRQTGAIVGGPRDAGWTLGATGEQRAPAAPHLAQLLVDELLQLRGFLRRQRHAGAGASPPILSASGAPTARRAPSHPRALVAAEHRAGEITRHAQLPGNAAPRQACGRAGGEAAAQVAPNSCFETAPANQASGLSPALPDLLHQPLLLLHGSHLVTSAHPNALPVSADALSAPISPSLAVPFCLPTGSS